MGSGDCPLMDSDGGDNGKDEALGARIRRCIRAARGCLTTGRYRCRWALVPHTVRDIHVGELQVTVQTDSIQVPTKIFALHIKLPLNLE